MITMVKRPYEVLRKYAPMLLDFPADVRYQRKFHSELTDSLEYAENAHEFTIGLIYRCVLDDMLKNFMEDDCVDKEAKIRAVRAFAETIQHVSGDHNKWLKGFEEFGRAYRRLPEERVHESRLYLNGVELTANVVKPPLFEIGQQEFTVFPNLDNNLSNPQIAKHLCEWFEQKFWEVRDKVKSESGVSLNALGFIEKSYSSVGAITLMPYLVSKLGLPATIYRPIYWDKHARISGQRPLGDEVYCFVYDVCIDGDALVAASRFLRQNYGAKTKAALVFFYFEKGPVNARERLKREGIILESYLRTTNDVLKSIQSEIDLARKLMDLHKSSLREKSTEEHVIDVVKTIKEHIKAR